MQAGKDNLSEPVKNEPPESKRANALESKLAEITAKLFLVMNAAYTTRERDTVLSLCYIYYM